MNTPKPTASSLVRNSGWVIISSRSTSVRITPAVKAPRITSRPSCVASATNPISSTNAPRTRIWAVVSCSRRSVSRIRFECSIPAIVRPIRIATRKRLPSSRNLLAVPLDSREKKIESRWPEDDAEDYLEHDRGQEQPREESEHQRREEAGRDDDQQVREVEVHQAAAGTLAPSSARAWTKISEKVGKGWIVSRITSSGTRARIARVAC